MCSKCWENRLKDNFTNVICYLKTAWTFLYLDHIGKLDTLLAKTIDEKYVS